MLTELKNSCIVLVLMTAVTGGVYPLVVTLFANTLFSHQAGGSLIIDGGSTNNIRGSELIGQAFTKPEYFWGRLSATSPEPYNAAASSGSNLGPSNAALKAAAEQRAAQLLGNDPGHILSSAPVAAKIPIDLLTASGSGLDPHISPEAAEFQVARVAKARGIQEDVVRQLVEQSTEGPQFGLFGMARVNILQLNRKLDERNDSKL